MEMQLVKQLKDENLLAQLRELLILGDKEFVPPISSRSSTTQQGLDSAVGNGIDLYFEEMKQQCFVLAMDGDILAGFMSFKINHQGAHIPPGDNVYASTSVVHPDYRGKGMMTALYQAIIDAFPDRPLFSRTWHENYGHLKVVRRLGFHRMDFLPNDRGEGIHTVYYCHRPGDKPSELRVAVCRAEDGAAGDCFDGAMEAVANMEAVAVPVVVSVVGAVSEELKRRREEYDCVFLPVGGELLRTVERDLGREVLVMGASDLCYQSGYDAAKLLCQTARGDVLPGEAD